MLPCKARICCHLQAVLLGNTQSSCLCGHLLPHKPKLVPTSNNTGLVLQRGNHFAETSVAARQTIAELGARFIRPGCTVLVHGFSRVALALLRKCAKSVSPPALRALLCEQVSCVDCDAGL